LLDGGGLDGVAVNDIADADNPAYLIKRASIRRTRADLSRGGADGLSWDVDWYDPIVGLVALPAIMVALGLVVRPYAPGPIRFTEPVGLALNLAVIVGRFK
jgi:hypothetical protein